MATGGCPSWRPNTQRQFETFSMGATAARQLARKRARAALEAALRPLLLERGAPGSWVDRERASRPALRLVAAGERVPGVQRRRRNAAWHASRVPIGGFASASSGCIAWAAAGPRLGQGGRGLLAAASPFVPQAACSAAGIRCTCGATVWPRHASLPAQPPSADLAAAEPVPLFPATGSHPPVVEGTEGGIYRETAGSDAAAGIDGLEGNPVLARASPAPHGAEVQPAGGGAGQPYVASSTDFDQEAYVFWVNLPLRPFAGAARSWRPFLRRRSGLSAASATCR